MNRADSDLRHELERFDAQASVERAATPPASWYTRQDVLDLELERVLARGWRWAGRAESCAAPGAYFTGELAGRPYVVVRDTDGTLRAFHNVCRHHAAAVATGAGTCERLQCPYHGWTYGLDGRLIAAPRVGGIEDFDRAAIALPAMDVCVWGPLVFVAPGGGGADVEAPLAPLAPLTEGDLVFVARREYELACNWKVFVDNYLDGGYHVPVLHGALSGRLDLASYRTELFEQAVLQSCAPAAREEPGPDFAERIGAGARYGWAYPNLMLNRYGPVLDTNVVLPAGPGRCRVVMDYWLEPEHAADSSFVERCLAASEQVQHEDVSICEAVQRGLASGSYDTGRYAPRVEAGMHLFHRLLAADLRART